MKRSIYIFILFFVSQIIVAFVAFAMVNASALASGGPLMVDVAAYPPVTIGQATCVAEVLLILALIAFRLTSTRRPLTDAFRRGMPRRWWLALLAFVVLSFGIAFVLVPLKLDDFGMQAQFEGMTESWVCILTLVVVAPVAEELVFRDGIQREMMAAGAKPWVAIATSALAFGVVHGDPAQMVPAALMGGALGWLYYTTGDVRLCVPAHIINNAISLGMMQYPEIDESIAAASPWLTVIGGISMCIVAQSMFVMARKKSNV